MTVSNSPFSGKFITFEGGEGVGKSTNIDFVHQLLEAEGFEVVVTREPGGTYIAELIREELLKKAHPEENLGSNAELLLMFAARSQHIEKLIIPALKRGAWVLCDRFTDSTIAYQGYGRGLAMESIQALKHIVQNGLEPDATYWLDAPVEIGMGRARNRGPADRFEVEEMAFFERVRQGFVELAEGNSKRIIKIDAAVELKDVQVQLKSEIERLIANV